GSYTAVGKTINCIYAKAFQVHKTIRHTRYGIKGMVSNNFIIIKRVLVYIVLFFKSAVATGGIFTRGVYIGGRTATYKIRYILCSIQVRLVVVESSFCRQPIYDLVLSVRRK